MAATAAAAWPGRARAAGAKSLTIGVCSDFSGVYSDIGGKTSVACVQQAIEDFGAAAKGYDVKVIQGDHQNKPDVGAGLARQWFDNGVDMLIDVPNSAVGLAIASVAAEKNKTYINANSATSLLTGKKCNASTIHWTYDTYMLSHSTGGAMVAAGGKSWFFITANYAFGQLLRDQTTGGGQGRRRHGGGRCRLSFSADHGLLVLSVAGAIIRGPGTWPRQCRQGHGEFHQAGASVRHHPERHEDRRPADLS